jgi:flagellar biosynthetic protein FliR
MIPLSADIIERLAAFLWPMLRISAMVMTAPPFSGSAVTARIRVLLALVLTWMVYPLHTWPVIDPMSAEGLVEVFNQLLIGAAMGLTLQIVVAALTVAGQTMAASMGLSMANMIDPNVGNVPTLAQFLIVCSTLIFVSIGGPGLLVGLILESFRTLPIGTSILTQDVYARMVQWSSMMFLGALLLALPVVATLLFVNIGLGVVTRAAPSLNIFAIGFPAMIAAGFLVLIISMDVMSARMQWLWQQGFMAVRELLRIPGG